MQFDLFDTVLQKINQENCRSSSAKVIEVVLLHSRSDYTRNFNISHGMKQITYRKSQSNNILKFPKRTACGKKDTARDNCEINGWMPIY